MAISELLLPPESLGDVQKATETVLFSGSPQIALQLCRKLQARVEIKPLNTKRSFDYLYIVGAAYIF